MLIVDVYNVLHVTGVLPAALADLGVTGLARMIDASRFGPPVSGKSDRTGRSRGTPSALLVCDGTRKPFAPVPASCRVVFSGPDSDADTLIERVLESGGARGMVVASSDARVRRAARRRRARSIDSETLLRMLLDDRQRNQRGRGGEDAPTLRDTADAEGLSTREVESWMREFRVEGDWKPEVRLTDELAAKRRAPMPESEQPVAGGARPTDEIEVRGERDRETGRGGGGGGGGGVVRYERAREGDAARREERELMELIKVWAADLRLDDLDMDKWLGSA